MAGEKDRQLAIRYEAETLDETRAYWDRVLDADGIEDLECGTEPTGCLRTRVTLPSSLVEVDERQRYFALAQQYLRSGRFRDQLEREIWRRHVDGRSYREIVADERLAGLAQWLGRTVYLKLVHGVINKHRDKMLGRTSR